MKIKPLRPMNAPPIWLQDGFECMEAHFKGHTYPINKLGNCIVWLRSTAQLCDIHAERQLPDTYYTLEIKEWAQAEFARLCLVLNLTDENPIL